MSRRPRFGHFRASVRIQRAKSVAVALRRRRVQALRAGQGQRSPWQRPRVSSGWRFAPACCAAQSVYWRTAHGRTGSFCRRRARGARGRQRLGWQCRYKRSCGRGLTGQSTGGATAGRLARAALFVYAAPRGQGNLPRHPGYLYVRPRWRHGAGSTNRQRVSVTLSNPKRTRAEQFLSLCSRASCSAQALRARQSLRSSSVRPRVSSGRRFAPACCAAQSVSGRAAHGTPDLLCRRRERGARGRQRFGCQRRRERSCVRGLTGRSTGGATAGHLARVAQCAYPPPRGQGSLPRLPGYLYVRPRRQQRKSSRTSARFGFICKFSRRAASTAASRRRGTPSVRRVRSAPVRAIVLCGSA